MGLKVMEGMNREGVTEDGYLGEVSAKKQYMREWS